MLPQLRRMPSTWTTRLLAVAATVLVSSTPLGCDRAADGPAESVEVLLDRGDLEGAALAIEEQLRAGSRDRDLLLQYALLQMKRGLPSLAIWPLRVLRHESDPDWRADAGALMVQAAAEAHDADLVAAVADEVLAEEPDRSDVRRIRADSNVARKAFDQALEDAAWLLEEEPDDVAALSVRLQALLGLERFEEFETALDELDSLASQPSFEPELAARFCTARAVYANERGDSKLAESRFEACLAKHEDAIDLLTAAVGFFDRIGSSERATKILEVALARSPDRFGLREGLANRLRTSGDPAKAEALLREGTTAGDGQAGKAWTALAYHFFDLGEYERAIEAWQEAFETTPDPSSTHRFAFAEALVEAGRYDESAAIAGELPVVFRELLAGLAALRRGDARRALVHFDAGQRLWPDNASARYYAGLAAEHDGDLDRAIEEYRQAIRIDAAATSAAWRLACLLEAQGDTEAARIALGHHLGGHPGDLEAHVLPARIVARAHGLEAVRKLYSKATWPRQRVAHVIALVVGHVDDVLGPEATIEFVASLPADSLATSGNVAALRTYVDALIAVGDLSRAREVVKQLRARMPESPDPFELDARIELARHDGDASVIRSSLERALAIDPEHGQALATSGRLAVREGRNADAIASFERALRRAPAAIDIRRDAIRAMQGAHLWADAERAARAWITASPGDPEAALGLAEVVLARGDDAALAERHARAAVRLRGGAPARDLLARIEAGKGGRAHGEAPTDREPAGRPGPGSR